jgi:hypothetical protein
MPLSLYDAPVTDEAEQTRHTAQEPPAASPWEPLRGQLVTAPPPQAVGELGLPAEERLAQAFLVRHPPGTRAAYARALRHWAAWCAARELPPLQAGREHVELWLRGQEEPATGEGEGDAASTRAVRLAAVGGFYEVALDEQLVVDPRRERRQTLPARDRCMPGREMGPGTRTQALLSCVRVAHRPSRVRVRAASAARWSSAHRGGEGDDDDPTPASRRGGTVALEPVSEPPRRRSGSKRRATPPSSQAETADDLTPWQSPGDGIEYRLHEGHELRVVLRNLTEREVSRIGGEGEVHLALVVEPLVFTLLAWFDGVIPWSGGPYSWHRLREEEREVPPELGAGERAQLTVVLVEGRDGVIKAVRPLTLSAEFSQALHRALREQAELPYDEEEYQRQAGELARHWEAGDIVERAQARWSSGRAGTWHG